MTNLEQQFQDKLKGFKVMSITNVNHKPHPYTVGGRHVSWVAENHNGILSEQAIKDGEKHGIYCEHPNCTLPYDQHTFDRVLFLQLTRNMSREEASEQLNSVVDSLKEHKIDGISFVETTERYRIK